MPWLATDDEWPGEPIKIWAGAQYDEFVAAVERAGGSIWISRAEILTGAGR